MLFWLSLIFAVAFALIHLSAKKLLFLETVPRSKFLSIAGGIAVAYVFIHLLPELSEHQEVIEESLTSSSLAFIEAHIYLVSLVGLTIFYGLERMVKVSKEKKEVGGKGNTGAGIFWIHIGSFFFYNALIGYLLVTNEFDGASGMFFYFLALAVHFVTNDFSLRESYEKAYDRYGRWLLSGAILFGWFIGSFMEVSEFVTAFLTAFIAGGVILNILKEELPEERKSSFSAFLIGIVGYTVILLLI